jgi:signal transduction histidine kinase
MGSSKFNGHLQQKIAERGHAEESLRQSIAELEAQVEELKTFARNVAHSLHAQLSLTIGFAQFLQQESAALPREELHNYLYTIEQNGRKMSQMIDELFLLAGVYEKPVEKVPLDMARILGEVRPRLASMIDEYQAEIILPADWPVALGYGPWVEEIWANLVSNAIKYGGEPPLVELGGKASEDGNGMVCFWVRDNGPGLTLEEQDQLFEPFIRLHPDRAEGHGLGLSIVRAIVTRLGGQVGVKKSANGGSVFIFTLPGASEA